MSLTLDEPRHLHRVADNLWTQQYPLSVLGAHHGRTLTLIRLDSGRTILHSMGPFTNSDIAAIRSVGPPSWLVEAMLLHDTYAWNGREAFPGLPFLAPPGFAKITGFPTVPLMEGARAWQGEVEVIPIEGMPRLREHVLVHVPSRTLIVADLIFNFRPDERGWTRFFHRHIAGFKRYPALSRPFRLCIHDREAFHASIARVMEEDFDRIIVGHGEIIPRDGKQLLQRALADAGLG